MIIIPIILLIVIANVIVKDVYGTIIGVAMILFICTAKYLASRDFHNSARLVAIVPLYTFLSILTCLFGHSLGIYLSTLVMSLGILILFDSTKIKARLLILVFSEFIGAEWYLSENGPVFEMDYVGFMYHLVFLTNFISMIVIMVYFSNLGERYEIELGVLVKDLQKKNKNLKSVNEELGQFAYTASHHLKSPLKNISNLLGLIEKTSPLETEPTVSKYLSIVKDDSQHLFRLIEDILSYSTVEGYQQRFIATKTDLSPLLDRIQSNLAELLARTNGVIRYEKLMPVPLGVSHSELLLQNLIQNGLKYNDSPRPTIDVSSIEENGVIHLSVCDNGIGISEEYHQAIFNPFTRLHSREQVEGTGIGLSICKKILDLHHGEMAMESEIGKGTCFHMKFDMLPVHDVLRNSTSQTSSR
ncbi:MAG: HAMP domain-containing histidine kinase [Bacteroidia bacterium]|nr:HAMP domain-containing histidine kinase [Bacteroidia bacterium]